MPIESGRYTITHAQYWNLAFPSDANDGTSLLGCLEQDVPGEEWNIKELRNGRYSIVNFGHKMFASAEFHSKKGDHVVGRETNWLWLITEHDSGKYTISTANGKLRWFLEDDWPKTPITLHDAPPSYPRCHWKFQKIGRMNTTHHEAAVVNAELAREVEVAREEVAQAKSEAARTLAELEVARREAAAVKEVAAESATRREEEAEAVASRQAAEVEEAKREAAQAKEELARSNLGVRSYFNMLSQCDNGRYPMSDNKEPRLIQASLLLEAEKGYDMAAQLIIAQEGVNVNSTTNKYRVTPLSLAAQNGHDAVVRVFLAKEGVDVNSKELGDSTPLIDAAKNGHDAVVRLLLAQEGVDVNFKKNGETPLHVASRNGHDAVVQLLLGQDGVYVSVMNNDGETPLMLAEKKKHRLVVRLLREKLR